MMKSVKRAYDFESFELDNVYNDDENRYPVIIPPFGTIK